MTETVHEMTMNEYQNLALETAIYPQPIIYPALGLTDEHGQHTIVLIEYE